MAGSDHAMKTRFPAAKLYLCITLLMLTTACGATLPEPTRIFVSGNVAQRFQMAEMYGSALPKEAAFATPAEQEEEEQEQHPAPAASPMRTTKGP
jgi:hypothetical protein